MKKILLATDLSPKADYAFKRAVQLSQEMQNADLIAMGAHGQTGLALSRLGGVTADILARPPCDVLVARR